MELGLDSESKPGMALVEIQVACRPPCVLVFENMGDRNFFPDCKMLFHQR